MARGAGSVVPSSAGTVEGRRDRRCRCASVEFIGLPVAYDALTVVVNAGNAWATSITITELRKLWSPPAEKSVVMWKQVRADWPDQELRRHLHAQGGRVGCWRGHDAAPWNSYKLAMQRLGKGIIGTMYKSPEDTKLGVDLLMER